ncbi:flagellar basal body rod protein FlgC [Ectothiorhodospira lacustris]|uniref:flagellar basal body rod protein FlgC n=1 Tax=Ectothiorhodospira lacustris TaxID=2899127 RepID=UPI001EE8B2BC|nr:flagellar basal body rod protein FlgC [Ectothiorhodospira lacustris]MCG5499836.1 flagellar basal body rod protein FlgC [Ectothiorhodospira lacustris]MCG5511031.1 flagellar basal body rod protein FlgC [Ectothiorhodospira lacustris]MCG5522761.1 flagellar basal body rod protein FlgC [Ectothiorhodospira lacustris]
MSNMFKIFDVSGSALSAQSVRLNTIASNMANAQVASTTPEQAYRSKQPVFQTVMDQFGRSASTTPVRVAGIVESQAEPFVKYEPHHPLANEQGYVYMPNVNLVDEMANMISASRSYENNVEVMNTTKQLLLRTLQLGQS